MAWYRLDSGTHYDDCSTLTIKQIVEMSPKINNQHTITRVFNNAQNVNSQYKLNTTFNLITKGVK